MDEFSDELTVTGKERLNDEVVLLTLGHPDGGTLPPWSPGAHLDLVLGNGLVRQYSLCGDVHDRSRYQVAVLREPSSRGGSRYVHDTLALAERVPVRGPRNHFELLPAPRYRFIAGGIGITPLLPMIAAAEAAHADWRLLYGGRSRSSMAFTELLAGYGERVTVCPQDESGLLDLDRALGDAAPDTLVYACGPEPLLAAVEESCRLRLPGALHLERFTPQAQPGGPDGPFEVVLKQSAVTLAVPGDRSVLAVLEEAGIPVLSSCREGVCGTCEVTVVEGQPDHRDSVLSESERDAGSTMMVCVSRALGDRLVFDL